MAALRTVAALEHEVIRIVTSEQALDDVEGLAEGTYLTETDAQALLRMNDVRRGFCQRVSGGIKLAQYCGIVRLPTCVLEVLPKVGLRDARTPQELEQARTALLTLLSSARHLALTKVGVVSQHTVRAPMLDVFIEAFLHCALEQARRGLLCRYVANTANLSVVKGRFHVRGHLRHNLNRPQFVHCEHDEFTADNAYNQAIHATLKVCRPWLSSTRLQRLWFETQARYAGVSLLQWSATAVARLPRERTTARYESVLAWCEWLLALSSPALSTGPANAPGLLFDMNKLFEAHVSALEEAAAGEHFLVRRQGPSQALASLEPGISAFDLKPDITVWHKTPDGGVGTLHRVVDAKWKRLDLRAGNAGVAPADVYQLLAYAVRYQCRSLELVYPVSVAAKQQQGTLPVFRIAQPGYAAGDIEIRVRTVTLGPTGKEADLAS